MVTKAGIDYGNGQTNIDKSNGIRYGVISPGSLNPEALSDIYDHGEDMNYRQACEDLRERVESALSDILDDCGLSADSFSDYRKRERARIIDETYDALLESANDSGSFDSDCDGSEYHYERDGYVLETTSLGIYVIKSPFVTKCRLCSPCAPGAGDLDSPDDENGALTYCLGADWFDDEQAPYAIEKLGN